MPLVTAMTGRMAGTSLRRSWFVVGVMDILLWVIAAIVGVNAVVVASLVVRYRTEQRDDVDDQLDRIAQLWIARRLSGEDSSRASAA